MIHELFASYVEKNQRKVNRKSFLYSILHPSISVSSFNPRFRLGSGSRYRTGNGTAGHGAVFLRTLIFTLSSLAALFRSKKNEQPANDPVRVWIEKYCSNSTTKCFTIFPFPLDTTLPDRVFRKRQRKGTKTLRTVKTLSKPVSTTMRSQELPMYNYGNYCLSSLYTQTHRLTNSNITRLFRVM